MPNFGELKPKLMEGDLDLHASINCFEHINDSVTDTHTIVFACTATYTAITERRRRCRPRCAAVRSRIPWPVSRRVVMSAIWYGRCLRGKS